jgi:hypothetical protein
MRTSRNDNGSASLRFIVRAGAVGLGLGLGLALGVPLLGAGAQQRRRLFKGALRGCADLQQSLRARLAEAQESMSDVWAEVQAERAAGAGAPHEVTVESAARRARETAPRAHAAR